MTLFRTSAAMAALLLLLACGHRPLTTEERDARLEQGLELLAIFDFEGALRHFSAAFPQLPEEDLRWPKFAYATAVAHAHTSPPRRERIEAAATIFERLATREGAGDIPVQARLELARLLEVDLGQPARARVLYREVFEERQGDFLGYQALLRLAGNYVQELTEESVRQAVLLIEEQIERFPQSEWTGTAGVYLATLHANYLGQPREALRAYQIAMEAGFPNRTRADVYVWHMAQLARQIKEEELAILYYQTLVRDFPRSIMTTLARDRVAEFAAANPEADIEVPQLQQFRMRVGGGS
jgi:tetratricopeptide (TPR) repeat protein